MAGFETYQAALPHAQLTRSPEGALDVLHTNGGTPIFGCTHGEFVELFHQIKQDLGTRVVILTGAGGARADIRAGQLCIGCGPSCGPKRPSVALRPHFKDK